MASLVSYLISYTEKFMAITKTTPLQSLSIITGCLLGLSANIYAIDPHCHERHETCPQHFPKTSYATNYQNTPAQKEPTTAPLIIATPVSTDDDRDGIQNNSDQCPSTPSGYKVDAKGCPIGLTLNINFAFASNILPASSDADVDTLVKYLKDNPTSNVSIVGHTDNNGIDARNQPRSVARAKALGDNLVANGIDSNRITTSGEGSKRPIATNDTDTGRAQNRRIEVVIK